MAYVTIAEVEGRCAGLMPAIDQSRTFTANSIPNVTHVGQYITQIEGELDAVLASLGIAVPLTATASINAIKNAVLFGVAGLVYDTYHRAAGATDAANNEFLRQYYDYIDNLLSKSDKYLAIFSATKNSNASYHGDYGYNRDPAFKITKNSTEF